MGTEERRTVLRIFVDTRQKWRHRPVYEVLVERARGEGLAGATVLAGVEGFGQRGRLLRDEPWALGNDREVVVEVLDEAERVDRFLSGIEPMLRDAVVTLEDAWVLRSAAGAGEEGRS